MLEPRGFVLLSAWRADKDSFVPILVSPLEIACVTHVDSYSCSVRLVGIPEALDCRINTGNVMSRIHMAMVERKAIDE